jgi:proliferating cell nuclear antigen
MMNITARQDTIRIIVDILSTLVEEARFNFNADNLEIRVVDPSHVAMIRMEIDKSAFESWEVDETVLGLELSKLSKLVSLAGTGDLLEINFDEGFGRVNINVGEIERVIRPLDRQNMQEPRVPDLDVTTLACLSGAKFARALKAADQVGDLVTFSLDQNKFNVNVSGESDSVSVTYEAGELQELVCDNPVKSQYSLQYLLPLAKRIESTVDSITVRFGENYPLRLEFDIADGQGKVVYFLAPRVEGDA